MRRGSASGFTCAASEGGVACSRWSRVVAIALLDVRSDPDGLGVRVVAKAGASKQTILCRPRANYTLAVTSYSKKLARNTALFE